MNFETVFLASKWDEHWAKVAEAMPEAVSNFVIGVLVVFCALLFFSFVISLLKYVNVIGNKKAAKKEPKSEEKAVPMAAIENTVAQIEEEELCNDAELVACGITPDLVRMSCGLESKEDLIEDIKQALEAI